MHVITVLLAFVLSLALAASPPPLSWCAAQKKAPVVHGGCNAQTVLAESKETLTWMRTRPANEQDVLACQASGSLIPRWITACMFTSNDAMQAFEKEIRALAADTGMTILQTSTGREFCSAHPDLTCVYGSKDPILYIHVGF